ncbi:MAG: DUF1566 domain-containing protein [Methylococcaceae bacterium]
MKTKFLTTVAVLALSLSAGAQASLTSSGPLTVYDSVQNLTWTKNANLNGTMNWSTAVAWANNLNYAGYTDWVLPTIDQLTTQFSTNLGKAAGVPIISSHNGDYNLFTNIQSYNYSQSYNYWSGSVFAPNSIFAWYFGTGLDGSYIDYKFRPLYAWAVRPGDVAAVPVPGAFWLFSSALVGLMGLKRRGNIW